MYGQQAATPQVVLSDRIGTRTYWGDGVEVLAASRLRMLIAVLSAIFIHVAVTKPVVAQATNLAMDRLAADYVSGTTVHEMGSHTDGEAAAQWIAALRDRDCGIHIEPVYYGEVFTNARGGISTNHATQYEGLFDLPLTFNFEQLRMPVPGKFFLLAQNTHGRGLTQEFVGDTLVLSNIDSFDNIMQVGEYWWEFGALDDAVTVRLGKQDVNHEFLLMDSAADFVQSSFTLSPDANLPSYPHQTMAAVVLVQLQESLQFKAGVWDALAAGGSWGFSGQGTTLFTGELEYTYALFDGMLPGTLSGGVGYLSEGEVSGERFGVVHGYAVQLEQQIYRECDGDVDDIQGLGVFVAYYPRFQGAPIPTDTIGDDLVAGLVYTGLIPQRDRDVLGAGVVWAELFQGGTNQESVFELFYKAAITPRISFQPDLQYIVTPSGLHRDAIAVGLRFQVTL